VYAAEGVVPAEFDGVEAETVFRIGGGRAAGNAPSANVAAAGSPTSPGRWWAGL
jgi:hypothetical protein